jgi:hypothetical protein
MKDIKKKIAKVLDTSAMDNTRLKTGKDIGRALISTQDGLIDTLLYVQNVRENLEDEINRFIDSKNLHDPYHFRKFRNIKYKAKEKLYDIKVNEKELKALNRLKG